MIGILTEKPSAGRNFATALGGVSGSYNGQQYVIVSSKGHLYEFADPSLQVKEELQEKYKSWDLSNLPWDEKDFIWKRIVKPETAAVLKPIKEVLSKCDEVVIATDVDPTGEGELLAWEILEQLHIRPKKFTRMYFEDESAPQIQKAFMERKIIPSMEEDTDYRKALYRSKWDFLSMQFTRVASKCGDGRSVLRQGRLKSAMVKIVGDGLKAVSEYKKIPYYQNRFKDENGNIYTNPEEPTFPESGQVPNTYHSSRVIVDSTQPKRQIPPKLLDLAALSSILSAKGIKAKDVLSVYQKMYEDQIVSYPRTEDKTITPQQFADLLPKVDKIAALIGVDTPLLTHRQARKSHVVSGGAHGANRPGPKVPESLESLKKYGSCAPIIYEVLARNYLAMLAEDYEYDQQKGHIEDYPAFTGSVNIPRKWGYKAIFNLDAEEDNGKCLGKQAQPFVYEGFPPKPPTPTTKWLMTQLERADVGTGATRTGIYADVTNENSKYPLLIEQKGKLSMTQYGQMSYLLLADTHIGNLSITEQLQQDMRDIAAGIKDPDECLSKVQQLVMEDMAVMQKNALVNKEAINSLKSSGSGSSVLGKCPSCGGDIVDGKFGPYCKSKCGLMIGKAFGKSLSSSQVKQLLSGKRIMLKGLTSKSGKKYDAYISANGTEKYKDMTVLKFNMEFK